MAKDEPNKGSVNKAHGSERHEDVRRQLEALYRADEERGAQRDTVDAVMAHLGNLFDKSKGSKSAPILKSFQDLAGDKDLKPATIRTIFRHASETGKDEVGCKQSQLWHFFEDVFSKTTSSYKGLPAEKKLDPVIDVLVISRWNAANFPKIMGYKEASNLPSFPASVEELQDFRAIPAYFEKVVMPILKAGISERLGLSAADMEDRINAREQELICNKVPTYEAIMPIGEGTPFAKGKGKSIPEMGLSN